MTRSLIILAGLLLASCGQDGSADIKLSNAWARPTIGQTPGAVYLTIENNGDAADRLTGAATDLAAMAMVHQNEVVDGVAKMRMAGEINLPAHDRIEMKPGGTHIMLEGLRAPLKAGDDFDLVLRFRSSKDQTVKVTVVESEGA
ncbi:copper chaperone PCu(A)C [Sphingomonas sp. RB56-2]|uniref:Copper chaperone PCu(A)C n=1 Tax=Sphingomonas brevis TaxID=2908206 RepID=A0ABT0S9S7_9SPHN|nr:copper chaperone PCu(A)C [Sphingomonas brevis]MCL6740885.1 copper chaperone PCu(A)C [Sphingomonas brevis]